MKILFFGRGVINTQYAWALEQAGNEVVFYVRPGRIADWGETVHLNIYDGRKKVTGKLIEQSWKIKMQEDLSSNHDFDLIVVSVPHYQFSEVTKFLEDKIGNASLLIFNNFWKEPLEEVVNLPIDQLVWGFPGAGGGFHDGNVLHGAFFNFISIGTFGTPQTERGKQVINTFKKAGFKVKEYDDFRSYLLTHFVVNAAMHLENAKGSEKGFVGEKVLKSTSYWKNVQANGKQLLPLLEARNVDLKVNSETKMFSAPAFLLSFVMKIAFRFVPSVKTVFTMHANPTEIKAFPRDVFETAKELNIALPRYQESISSFKE